MDLEKEIAMLKEKVALLEKIKELQDVIKAEPRKEYIPYPSYPHPWYPSWPTYPQFTWDTTVWAYHGKQE